MFAKIEMDYKEVFTARPVEDPDRIYVNVDNTFDIQINRTEQGLIISVYEYGTTNDPIRELQVWDDELEKEQC